MKNKVLVFNAQNSIAELEHEMNTAITKANGNDWRVVSAKTECIPFGERNDSQSFHEAWHLYFTTTILLEKEASNECLRD